MKNIINRTNPPVDDFVITIAVADNNIPSQQEVEEALLFQNNHIHVNRIIEKTAAIKLGSAARPEGPLPHPNSVILISRTKKMAIDFHWFGYIQ